MATGPYTLGPNLIEFDIGALRGALPLLARVRATATVEEIAILDELRDIATTVLNDYDATQGRDEDGQADASQSDARA